MSAFHNSFVAGAGAVDTPSEGPAGEPDIAQPVYDNQGPDGQEEEVKISGERVSLGGVLDVADKANIAAQDPGMGARNAKAGLAPLEPVSTTTALTPSKKRAADLNVAQLESAARGDSGDRPVQLAGEVGWLDYLQNMSADASPTTQTTSKAAARAILYYVRHKIAPADMSLLSKALASGTITNSQYKYDRGVEGRASSRIQSQILTDHVVVRARSILATAQETGTNLLTIPGPQLRTHLLSIFHADRLAEVLGMWEPLTGFVDFDIMYNVPASATAAQCLLLRQWRVYNKECWVLAMADAVLLRAKYAANREDPEEKKIAFRKWQRMLERPGFVPSLPPGVDDVPVVTGAGMGKRVKRAEALQGGIGGAGAVAGA